MSRPISLETSNPGVLKTTHALNQMNILSLSLETYSYHSHKISVIQSFFLTESKIPTLTAFLYVLSTHNVLWAELYSSSLNSHVEVLAPSTSEYDCI